MVYSTASTKMSKHYAAELLAEPNLLQPLVPKLAGILQRQQDTRGAGPVELPQIGERVVLEMEKLEADQTWFARRVGLSGRGDRPGDVRGERLLSDPRRGRVDHVQRAIRAVGHQTDVPDEYAAGHRRGRRLAGLYDAPADIHKVTVLELRSRTIDLGIRQIPIVVHFDRDIDRQSVTALEKLARSIRSLNATAPFSELWPPASWRVTSRTSQRFDFTQSASV